MKKKCKITEEDLQIDLEEEAMTIVAGMIGTGYVKSVYESFASDIIGLAIHTLKNYELKND